MVMAVAATEPREASTLVELVPARGERRKFALQEQRTYAQRLAALLEENMTSAPEFELLRQSESFQSCESVFYAVCEQKFALSAYVQHLVSSLECDDIVCIHALVYLERARAANAQLALNALNVHRLLLTAFSLALKFVEDVSLPSSVVADAGGLRSSAELALMERQFLVLIQHRCFVDLATLSTVSGMLR
mmetsp:Transcript_2802/g.7713  ORF Transcript_2802/g.7713 Transcript_2802/m.7713 type:complete len:191 (-) Transcript_2802:230-802(-)|eukprot:CAMPEP_0185834762 /NCGR_PEP_ID=MMETSP1353-20130828/6159_1 /TAXON_ID=1077150 /ORGANISM="Erythrolobus australicus, Strain CCMP3124" /LENGTH=190 /DNA_ID=CAMNT_0028533257 /DNA_START=609 /DNA_END=1181 /DNA_ORIENTATION=-